MRSFRAVVATLALVLALVPALVVTAASSAAAPGWSVAGISKDLMCPVCKERLDMSSSPAADRIRAFLQRAHRQRLSRAQVEQRLVAEYGDAVLAAPPRRGFGLTAWLVPALALLGGAAAAMLLARRWASRGQGASGGAPGGARGADRARLEQRLDAELERFE